MNSFATSIINRIQDFVGNNPLSSSTSSSQPLTRLQNGSSILSTLTAPINIQNAQVTKLTLIVLKRLKNL